MHRLWWVSGGQELRADGTLGDDARCADVRSFECDFGWLTFRGYRLCSGGGGSPALTQISRCGRSPRLNSGYGRAQHGSLGRSGIEQISLPAADVAPGVNPPAPEPVSRLVEKWGLE